LKSKRNEILLEKLNFSLSVPKNLPIKRLVLKKVKRKRLQSKFTIEKQIAIYLLIVPENQTQIQICLEFNCFLNQLCNNFLNNFSKIKKG
jgi:hypothetical protein